MKIITDSFFTIGRSHQVCEDYCISGEEPLPYVALSDGCSSSKNTDVGARLLCHKNLPILANLVEKNLDSSKMITSLISFPDRFLPIGMNNDMLDCTLSLCYANGKEGKIRTLVYGDGVIVESSSGRMCLIEIKYLDNMPYYISYFTNEKKQHLYEEHFSDIYPRTKLVLVNNKLAAVSGEDYKELCNIPYVCNSDMGTIDWVLIASDGLNSFKNVKTGEAIPLRDVVEKFTNFKVKKGEFVKRTAKKALKELAKQNIYPMDDISLGCLLNRGNYG